MIELGDHFKVFEILLSYLLMTMDINYQADKKSGYKKILSEIFGISYGRISGTIFSKHSISQPAFDKFVQTFREKIGQLKKIKEVAFINSVDHRKQLVKAELDELEKHIKLMEDWVLDVTNVNTETPNSFIKKSFEQSLWVLHELNEENNILSSLIRFQRFKNNGSIDLYAENRKGFSGSAKYFENDELLIITLSKIYDNKLSSYNHVALKVVKDIKSECCVGHKTFFNRQRNALETRPVQFLKIENENNIKISVKRDEGLDLFFQKDKNLLYADHAIYDQKRFLDYTIKDFLRSQADPTLAGPFDLFVYAGADLVNLNMFFEPGVNGKIIAHLAWNDLAWKATGIESPEQSTITFLFEGGYDLDSSISRNDISPAQKLSNKTITLVLDLRYLRIDIDTLSGVIVGLSPIEGEFAKFVIVNRAPETGDYKKSKKVSSVIRFMKKYKYTLGLKSPCGIIHNVRDLNRYF